jgi:hypothetical protein
MGAVRYRSTFYSTEGTSYQIDIYDADSSVGSPTTFNTYGEGFSLSYKGVDKDIHAPVIASSVEFYMAVEDAAAQTLLNDILTAQEKRFFLQIYKGGSFYWGGVILQDLGSVIDESLPSQVNLQAVDGIGYLKNFSYGDVNITEDTLFPTAVFSNAGYKTCIQHLANIFEGLLVIFTDSPYPSLTNILSTAVNFYEDNMYSGSPATSLDPLAQTKINHKAFIELPDNENEYQKAITYYQVLEQICLIFNARFYFADGKWNLININQNENASYNRRLYTYSGVDTSPLLTYTSTESFNQNITIDQDNYSILAQPSRTFYPNLVNAQRNFNKANSQNLLPVRADFKGTNDYWDGTLDIQSSAGNAFILKGTGQILVTFTESQLALLNVMWRLKAQLYFQGADGIKYLKSEPTTPNQFSWNSNPSHFYIDSDMFNITPGDGFNGLVFFSFDIETPKTSPLGGSDFAISSLYFNLHNTFFIGANNLTYVNPSLYGYDDITADYKLYNIELLHTIYGVVQPEPIESEYYAFNPESQDNTEFLEIEESLIGDDASDFGSGKLKIINTSGSLVDSSSWKVDATGTADKILNLQLTEVMQNRLKATPKLNCQIIGNINFNNTITYDSSKWMFLGANLSAGSDNWNAQFFELDISSATIGIVEKENLFQPSIKGITEGLLKSTTTQLKSLAGQGIQYKATTTNNTKTETYVNGSSSQRTMLNNNSIVNFKAYAVGVITTGSNKGDVIALEQFGCIKNIDKTCSIVGTTSETKKADSGVSGSVSLSVEPDSTNQAIKVSVVGEASESVEWKININLAEVSFLDTYDFIFEDGNNVITEASDDLVTELNIN